MIVAAGLGSRLSPLTKLCPKPAVPVRGIPLIGHSLTYLKSQGVTEVVVNTHHLADLLETTAREWCPKGIELSFSHESRLLGTGGGIGKNSDFLRESDPSIVIGGDMLIDFDLKPMLLQHQNTNAAATFLLKSDQRSAQFGSVGIDQKNCVRRVSDRFHLLDPIPPKHKEAISSSASSNLHEVRSGLYVWINLISSKAFDFLPEYSEFNHLDNWFLPMLHSNPNAIQAWIAEEKSCKWQPVGNMREYWQANFEPITLRYSDARQLSMNQGVKISQHFVIGRNARISPHANLDKVIVWDNETVPAGNYQHGIFASGQFHRILS